MTPLSLAPAQPREWVHAILDSNSEHIRDLRPSALNAPRLGRVAILARPGARHRASLTTDLLRALGISESVTGVTRDDDLDWELLHIWLIAYGIRDVIVVGTVAPEIVEDLALLTAGVGAEFWYITCPPRRDEQVEAIAAWTFHEQHWDDLPADWMADVSLELSSSLADDGVLTCLPDDDFTTFRASCRRLLTAEQFAWLDQRLLSHYAAAKAELAHPSEQALAEWMLARYDSCATLADVQIMVRATQTALFHSGWLLTVDLHRLISAAEDAPRRAQRTPALWRRLAVYRQPHRSMACVCAAAGMSIEEMVTAPIQAIHDGTIEVGGRSFALEPGTEPFVAAMLALRELQGTADTDPLFAHPDGAPINGRAIADAISAARRDVGLTVTSRRLSRSRPKADRWTQRWGLLLRPLAATARSSARAPGRPFISPPRRHTKTRAKP